MPCPREELGVNPAKVVLMAKAGRMQETMSIVFGELNSH